MLRQPKNDGDAISRAKQKEQSRARIIQATIDIVAEHGVSDATIRSIITRAGVSRGLAGYHFGNKRNLMVAAFRCLTDDYRELIGIVPGRQPDFGDDAEDVLGEVIRRCLDWPAEYRNRQYAWFGFYSLARTIPELRAVSRDSYEEAVQFLGRLLATVADRRGRVLEPERGGRALYVTIEGAWLHLTIDTLGFSTQDAIQACRGHAEALLAAAPLAPG